MNSFKRQNTIMLAHKEIIKTINHLRRKNIELSEDGILKVLNATKHITPYKETVDALIFLLTANVSNKRTSKILTTRELQILNCIGYGETSSNIAKQLNLSLSTIETHRKNIRKKLNLVGKGKLIEFAMLYNLKQDLKKTK